MITLIWCHFKLSTIMTPVRRKQFRVSSILQAINSYLKIIKYIVIVGVSCAQITSGINVVEFWVFHSQGKNL